MTPLRAFQQAISLHQQGRFREAEALYNALLEANERHFGALYQLGYMRLQQHRFDAAAVLFRRAIKVDKNGADAHHQLAVALTGLGRAEEAVKHYKRAIAIAPGYAEAHNNLGHALQILGRSEEALAQFERALALNPDYPEARNNLGSTLHVLRRSEEAIAHYHQALASRPDYPPAHYNLGNALHALGRYEEAITHYHTALILSPSYAEAHNALGLAKHRLGRSEEAVVAFRKAVALKSDYADAHHNLANALMALGKMHAAIAAFDDAIALAPKRAAFFLGLVNAKRVITGDRHFEAMLELARDFTSLSRDEQIALHFALAKAFADQGEHQQSFRHLLRGNTLVRKQITYEEGEVLARLEQTRKVFDGELIRVKQGLGHGSPLPIFIIGLPRSGTTLIEQILASHPRVFGAGELGTFGGLVNELKGPANTAYPEAVTVMSEAEFRELGERYVRAIARLAPQAERVTDKMPANGRFAGLIHLALPNARIIHTCRDLRDTALSCFSVLFAQGQEFSYDLAELGRYCQAYSLLMQHWRSVLPPTVLLEVQYEDVVRDLEAQARRIVDHCGLEWDDRCLSFHETQRSVRTASVAQVRLPIYHTSVGRWRRHEALLTPLLRALDG
jgi:tetratricopeptide (TPR) repeat protein